MALVWRPDFCPGNGIACSIEIERDWSAVRAFRLICPHHERVRIAQGLTPQQLFDLILQSSRTKEAARWALKQHMRLDKENPGLPWTVDADGNFTIVTGLPANERGAARAAANAAIDGVRKPAGTPTVSVL